MTLEKGNLSMTNPEVNKLEMEAIKQAESCDPPTRNSLLEALNLIEEAINICGASGLETDKSLQSLLNNKAQILRLLGRDSEALECLNLILSTSALTTNPAVIRQASAQRGWLHFRSGDNEAAFGDFERAGKLGCLESKRMAVRCNPYAAMCNQMLQGIIESRFYSK